MPAPPGPRRRHVLLILFFSAIIAIVFVTSFRSQPIDLGGRTYSKSDPEPPSVPQDTLELSQASLSGHVIAPKLGNETAKAELGRAAWKLFHTVMARFPDKPTSDESEALRSYVHLFQRLYPCGECAQHFREILQRYPPQVSSRSSAAAWACHVHNEVNKSLQKDLFDCSNIGDFYDCGCADDEKESMGKEAKRLSKSEVREAMSQEEIERLTGVNGRGLNLNLFSAEDRQKVQVEREGKEKHRLVGGGWDE